MFRKFSIMILGLVLLTGVFTVQAQNTGKTYILVHGAFQDASGWSDVTPLLEEAGNTVVAVPLPGHGDDTTPISDLTLNLYRDTVVEAIEEQEGSVILVGHSFGGIVISSVAEAIPDRIETLVYLAAYFPMNGESLVTLSAQDQYSVLGQEGNFILAEDFSTASVNTEVFASAFCPDCDETQLEAVAASQLAEPLVPLNEAVALTDENFGAVRKIYILTAQDVVVSPQLQALMIANTPVDHVYALNTGHAPYVSAPEALADVLLQVE